MRILTWFIYSFNDQFHTYCSPHLLTHLFMFGINGKSILPCFIWHIICTCSFNMFVSLLNPISVHDPSPINSLSLFKDLKSFDFYFTPIAEIIWLSFYPIAQYCFLTIHIIFIYALTIVSNVVSMSATWYTRKCLQILILGTSFKAQEKQRQRFCDQCIVMVCLDMVKLNCFPQYKMN